MGRRSAITRPVMPDANNWQIPTNVMNSITNSAPFHGLEDEDAPGHLNKFTRICDTFNIANVTRASIYLHLFPFSLEGRASSWLENLPPGSITTWENLQAEFLKKYFPPSKASRLRDQIYECESLFESFALAEQQEPSACGTSKTTTSSARGIYQVSNDTSIAAALEATQKDIRELKKIAQKCEICRGGHDTVDFPVDQQEKVDYLGNHNRGANAYGN
ncbi:uncharacterized protein LOC143616596 [Bidens hawaiensis]|uniref:uncharacterized protein LOC143616596 n=1 Tax=Bidens hawaiensis TaxID=980011 RepID=UPI00404A44B4